MILGIYASTSLTTDTPSVTEHEIRYHATVDHDDDTDAPRAISKEASEIVPSLRRRGRGKISSD